ncbi:winged helix family transcriptional regulator [Paenibacillus oralis]|uniref:Winged helix family transcriptional regulator n=2 Tax=Paenibacillus oralis TaxID=2490856 RepID=A0A3P3U777_9BACL|nr:winged helix family transcriptional regulator [Paenibacillus oralis]
MNLTIHKLPLGRNSYIDFDKSIFMKNDLQCALSHSEILLLTRLTENLGHIVRYNELLSVLYTEISVSDLQVYISRLRKKIEENPRKPKYLISIKGIGYMLTANRK